MLKLVYTSLACVLLACIMQPLVAMCSNPAAACRVRFLPGGHPHHIDRQSGEMVDLTDLLGMTTGREMPDTLIEYEDIHPEGPWVFISTGIAYSRNEVILFGETCPPLIP